MSREERKIRKILIFIISNEKNNIDFEEYFMIKI